MPQGAVRYQCPCGAKYLIAIRKPDDEEWLETLHDIGFSLGVDVIDSALPTFTCRGCGEIHIRADVTHAPGAQLLAARPKSEL
jgi:hypothetical protein